MTELGMAMQKNRKKIDGRILPSYIEMSLREIDSCYLAIIACCDVKTSLLPTSQSSFANSDVIEIVNSSSKVPIVDHSLLPIFHGAVLNFSSLLFFPKEFLDQ